MRTQLGFVKRVPYSCFTQRGTEFIRRLGSWYLNPDHLSIPEVHALDHKLGKKNGGGVFKNVKIEKAFYNINPEVLT